MTQEKDPTLLTGENSSPEENQTQTKKTGASRKSPASKSSTAKSPAKKSAAKKTETSAKKDKSTASSGTKKPAATAKSRKAAVNSPAPTEENVAMPGNAAPVSSGQEEIRPAVATKAASRRNTGAKSKTEPALNADESQAPTPLPASPEAAESSPAAPKKSSRKSTGKAATEAKSAALRTKSPGRSTKAATTKRAPLAAEAADIDQDGTALPASAENKAVARDADLAPSEQTREAEQPRTQEAESAASAPQKRGSGRKAPARSARTKKAPPAASEVANAAGQSLAAAAMQTSPALSLPDPQSLAAPEKQPDEEQTAASRPADDQPRAEKSTQKVQAESSARNKRGSSRRPVKAKAPAQAEQAKDAPAQAADAPREQDRTASMSPATLAERPVAKAEESASTLAASPEGAPQQADAQEAPQAETVAQASAAAQRPDIETETAGGEAPAMEAGESLQEEAQAENAQAETPRSSSRRSRRGGRRRNKGNRQAAAQNAENADDAAGEKVPADPSAQSEDATKADNETTETSSPDEGVTQGAQDAREGAKGKQQGANAKEQIQAAAGKRKMFISVLSGELVEMVLAEGGNVLEYYVEMQHQAKVKGNIYKAVVSNIDANLQAAFISYAPGVKNGFLQIDEVHPEYYLAHHEPAKGRKYPPIQKVLKPGQELLVQVVKEPAGSKGAFLTTHLSIPGRFLVLTPGREQIGVSRKVDNDEERQRLRGLLEGLKPGPGLGVIVRTVSSGAGKTHLQRDLQFLKRLWKEVRAKGQTMPSPSLIYEELDLSTRSIRDYLTEDIQEIWVDDAETAKQISELASLLFPKKTDLVKTNDDPAQPLFERFSLQKQLDQIQSREVYLPSGGRLVIDPTEALTAIDVNSGRSSGKNNFEDMAYRTNLDAANAIPRHLRLRDIGGQIVIDFIEMRNRDHWHEIEKAVRNGMKGDRARYDVGKIGPFGMMEIVRQRLGSSAISISTEPCPCCRGTGIRRNMEWQSMQCLREISRQLRQAAVSKQSSLVYKTEPELAFYLLNSKRTILASMEKESGVALQIRPNQD